jgi:hypothetical protein
MTDMSRRAQEALDRLEREQQERYQAPKKAEPPRTPDGKYAAASPEERERAAANALLAQLNRSISPWYEAGGDR